MGRAAGGVPTDGSRHSGPLPRPARGHARNRNGSLQRRGDEGAWPRGAHAPRTPRVLAQTGQLRVRLSCTWAYEGFTGHDVLWLRTSLEQLSGGQRFFSFYFKKPFYLLKKAEYKWSFQKPKQSRNTSLSLFNSEANVIPKCLQVRVRMLQNLRNRAMPHERRGGKGSGRPSEGRGPGAGADAAGPSPAARGDGLGDAGTALREGGSPGQRGRGHSGHGQVEPLDARPPFLTCRKAIACSGPGPVLAEAAATQKTLEKKQPPGNPRTWV